MYALAFIVKKVRGANISIVLLAPHDSTEQQLANIPTVSQQHTCRYTSKAKDRTKVRHTYT